jgi:fumarate reductase flavoprotein subunit
MQFEAGILDDSPSQFYADCMQEARARETCDPEVLWYYCQYTGFAIDWLDSLGAYPSDMRGPRDSIYGEPWTRKRAYFTEEGIQGGDKYLKVILAEYDKRIARGDIEVLFNTTLCDLITENGVVTGVKTIDPNGKEIDYKVKAVILCTGGYSSNLDMVRKYKWPNATDMVSIALPTCTGDGLEMCIKAGAELVNMDQEMAPNLGGIPDLENPGRRFAVTDMDKYPGTIWVDLNGKRIVNEDAGQRMPKTRLAIQSAPEMKAIVILDKKIKEENRSIFKSMFDQGKTWEEFEEIANEGKLVQKADTIKDLAAKLGIDGDVLQGTVTKYNSYVDAGNDPDFGRQDLRYKIENPPFYAFVTLPTVVMSFGGPKNNGKQQVLDKTGKVIPGLYVAGELAGYKGFGTGSGNIGGIVFGKRAGQVAAQYALSK